MPSPPAALLLLLAQSRLILATSGTCQDSDSGVGQDTEASLLMHTSAMVSHSATKPITSRSEIIEPATNKVVFMISGGCSGSTWIFGALSRLMKLHGVQVWTPIKEFDKNKVNQPLTRPFCTEPNGQQHFWPEGISGKLLAAQPVLRGNVVCKETQHPLAELRIHPELGNLTLDDLRDHYVKQADIAGEPRITEAELMRRWRGLSIAECAVKVPDVQKRPTVFFFDLSTAKGLRELTPLMLSEDSPFKNVIAVRRSNYLDRLICLAKDCWAKNGGHYPVDENGDESSLCFARRDAEEGANIRAHINATNLTEALYGRRPLDSFLSLPSMPRLNYEDYMAFEKNASASEWNTSVAAFGDSLRGLGIKPDRSIIERWASRFLQKHGTRQPSPHKSQIQNWQEVKRALQKTKYHWMWRN